MEKSDEIQYNVKGFDKANDLWVIRPAGTRKEAAELATLFDSAPELIYVSFGWNSSEPNVEEAGTIPDSISAAYEEICLVYQS